MLVSDVFHKPYLGSRCLHHLKPIAVTRSLIILGLIVIELGLVLPFIGLGGFVEQGCVVQIFGLFP